MRARAGTLAASSRTSGATAWSRRRRGPWWLSSRLDPARGPVISQGSARAYLHLPGKRFQGLRQLGKGVGVPLPAGDFLAPQQGIARLGDAFQRLQEHAELQIRREI